MLLSNASATFLLSVSITPCILMQCVVEPLYFTFLFLAFFYTLDAGALQLIVDTYFCQICLLAFLFVLLAIAVAFFNSILPALFYSYYIF